MVVAGDNIRHGHDGLRLRLCRLGAIDGVHHGLAGDGCAGQHIHLHRQRLAHKAVQEALVGRAALADAGGLGGSVHLHRGDQARVIQRDGHLHALSAVALGRALHRSAGHKRGQIHLRRLLHAKGHQIAAVHRLAQHHLAHGAQGLVGRAQHGGRGHGCAGQLFNGAALHRVQPNELLAEGFLQRAGTEAGALGKAGVAHDAAGHLALRVHAEGHGHGSAVTLFAGGHAVAHHIALRVARAVEAGYVIALQPLGDLLVASALGQRHHRAEGLVQRLALMSRDGLGGHKMRQPKHQRRNQRDDRQHRIRGQLLFRGCVLHG